MVFSVVDDLRIGSFGDPYSKYAPGVNGLKMLIYDIDLYLCTSKIIMPNNKLCEVTLNIHFKEFYERWTK